ncbi:MAG: hypothetical protein ACR2QK_16170, partial [Acidimicrobiales bacterium]
MQFTVVAPGRRGTVLVALVIVLTATLSLFVTASTGAGAQTGDDADRAGDAGDGTGSGESAESDQAQELAELYAPVIMVRAQDAPCDRSGERYLPAPAELVLDNPQVLLRQVGRGNPVVKIGPTAADLHNLGEGFYLDFPGDALRPGCIYE